MLPPCHTSARWFAAAFLPFAFLTSIFPDAPLDPQEDCGKKIYFQGVNCKGREIKALLGDVEVSAKVQSCASCHGSDGKGRAESGFNPGDITWEHLSVPYGHSHGNGRRHPAFTEQSFALAVTRGIDPGNHTLASLMPRFRMSSEELAQLAAYLKRLSTDLDPGLEPSTITIGILEPEQGPNAEAGGAVRDVLRAYFDEVNQRGGIYGRRIILQFAAATSSSKETIASAHHLMDAPVFAMIAPFVPGAEKDFVALAHESKLPVIGPVTLSVPDNPTNEVFYVAPGWQQLEEELVRWAAEQHHVQASRTAIVVAGKPQEEVSSAINAAWKAVGSAMPPQFQYARPNSEQLIFTLQQQRIDSVFFVGSGADALSWMQAAYQAGWSPQVFLLGPLMGSEVLEAPATFQGRIFVAYPALAAPSQGAAEFDAFLQRHHLPKSHRLLQVSAYCAARLFEDALTRTGSALSRQKLIRSLEQTHNFQTGLLPEITFGPNRRVGSARADIACLDLEHKRLQTACGEAP